MDSRKWIFVGVGATLAVVAIAYFSIFPKAPKRSDVIAKAYMSRPTQLSDSSEISAFLMNEEEVIGSTLQFPCNAIHELKLEFSTKKVLGGTRFVEMVPRKLDASEDDFHFVKDFSVDKREFFNGERKQNNANPQFSEEFQVKLKPGTYRVRYFFRSLIPTPQNEDPLPKVEYLGEGIWKILPSEENGAECVKVPLENTETVFPLKFGRGT